MFYRFTLCYLEEVKGFEPLGRFSTTACFQDKCNNPSLPYFLAISKGFEPLLGFLRQVNSLLPSASRSTNHLAVSVGFEPTRPLKGGLLSREVISANSSNSLFYFGKLYFAVKLYLLATHLGLEPKTIRLTVVRSTN